MTCNFLAGNGNLQYAKRNLYDGEENDPDAEIHGDDVEPVNWDEDDEDEEIKTDKMAEPKAESLGESLLSRVESELPSKVEQLKGDM